MRVVIEKNPLRRYLKAVGLTAEAFAAEHSFSPWTIRHYARGDKHPSLAKQMEIAAATNGMVKPSDWLEYALERAA